MPQIEINIFYFYNAAKKHFKLFVILNLVVIAIALCVAFLLPIQYSSKVYYYPLSEEATDPRNYDDKVDLYDETDHSSRFIVFGQSRTMKDILIKKFNLYKRYDIDTTNMGMANFLTLLKIDDFVTIKKDENGAICITVFDRDKDTCAMIANEILSETNKTFKRITHERNTTIYNVHKRNFDNISIYITELNDSLTNMKKSGKFSALQMSGVEGQIKSQMESYSTAKVKFQNLQVFINYNMETIQVIEWAQPALMKSKPKRTYILIISTILGFILLSCGFATVQFIKDKQIIEKL